MIFENPGALSILGPKSFTVMCLPRRESDTEYYNFTDLSFGEEITRSSYVVPCLAELQYYYLIKIKKTAQRVGVFVCVFYDTGAFTHT